MAMAMAMAPEEADMIARSSTTVSEEERRSFLVLGKDVEVTLVKIESVELQESFEMDCRRDDLSWRITRSSDALVAFSKKLAKQGMDLPSDKDLSPIPRKKGLDGAKVQAFLDFVFEDCKTEYGDLEKGVDLESSKLHCLDEVLSEFVSLSVASLKKEFDHEGKFTEGYLRKLPVYYHDELVVMNIFVFAQAIVGGLTLWVSFSYWSVIPFVIGTCVLWLLTFLYSFAMRPNEPGRTEIIPTCFLPGLGQLLVFGFVFYDYFLRRPDTRWITLRPGYIAYFESNYDYRPKGVFLIDRNTHIRSPWLHLLNPLVLQVANADQTLSLHFSTISEMKIWKRELEKVCGLQSPKHYLSPPTRRDLFTRPREVFGQRSNIQAQWYVDGKDLYRDIYKAFSMAKHCIYITDWMLSPELLLIREVQEEEKKEYSLIQVLSDAVKRGVSVHVLLYRDLEFALPNNSFHAKEELQRIGCQVIRHAAMSRMFGSAKHIFCCGAAGDIFWSHHEKLVIVDQAVAFCGGLDLAFGRYDDEHHRLQDDDGDHEVWPGKDYYNVRIKEFEQLEDPHTDLIDRTKYGRMPWHDIHCCVNGNAAKDIARHFIMRWNRELHQGWSNYTTMRKHHYHYILPAHFEDSKQALTSSLLKYECKAVRVLRSVGPWSGTRLVENSIKNKYLELIADAEEFIYIENQFFNSPAIADAICDRILQAIDDEMETFKVIIVLPQWPAFEGMPFDNAQTKIVLLYQHKTMDSILERIKSHPKIKSQQQVRQYISFCSLRKAEILHDRSGAISEQVYVHSKLLIVDDEKCIIGSANLNQRSLMGTRDSEVCVYIHSREFVQDLRTHLFHEHLGMMTDIHNSKELYLLFQLWDQVAEHNTLILENLFPGLQPSDKYTTIKKAKKALQQLHHDQSEQSDDVAEMEQQISQLKGHLVHTPLKFLRKEKNLLPSFCNDITTYILPQATFV